MLELCAAAVEMNYTACGADNRSDKMTRVDRRDAGGDETAASAAADAVREPMCPDGVDHARRRRSIAEQFDRTVARAGGQRANYRGQQYNQTHMYLTALIL